MLRMLWMSLLPAVALAAPASVAVDTSRQIYVVGDTVDVLITNSRGEPIYLPGCGALQIERFSNDRYLPVAGDACPAEGEAVEVAPGATFTITWPGEGTRAGEILRVGLPYGWGCTAGRALSQARCTEFATSWSASFRVAKRSEVQ